ncbi:unnamed protein product [Pieris macdunnoughi]|nr:unnamed protein product [Pieris macdunnoughi]
MCNDKIVGSYVACKCDAKGCGRRNLATRRSNDGLDVAVPYVEQFIGVEHVHETSQLSKQIELAPSRRAVTHVIVLFKGSVLCYFGKVFV